jgi:hypothetical protein
MVKRQPLDDVSGNVKRQKTLTGFFKPSGTSPAASPTSSTPAVAVTPPATSFNPPSQRPTVAATPAVNINHQSAATLTARATAITNIIFGWVRQLNPQSPLVGSLGVGIRMPLRSSDGRALTWEKLAREIASKAAAQGASGPDDCWFVVAVNGDTSGYPQKKLATSGERNKHALSRILHFLKTPADLDRYNADNQLQVAHRCRRGRFDQSKGVDWACVNPHHTVLVSDVINKSHDGCANGCAQLCPHTPKCLWTDAGGHSLPCRLQIPLPPSCSCGHHCF